MVLLVRAHLHVLIARLDAGVEDGAHALVLHLHCRILADDDGHEQSGHDEELHLNERGFQDPQKMARDEKKRTKVIEMDCGEIRAQKLSHPL